MNNIYFKIGLGHIVGYLNNFSLSVLFLLFFTQLSMGQATQLTPIGSTLNSITNTDDSYEMVDIRGVFSGGIKFGNITYTSMYVGSNGYVTFGVGNSGYNPLGISGYSAGPIIAAQYDDIDPAKGGDIYYSQNGTYLVVTFLAVAPYSAPAFGSGANTFQIILRQGAGYNGTTNLNFQIEVRYINMNWAQAGTAGSYPTAGWSTGTQVYGEMPYSGTADFLLNQSSSNVGQPGIYRWDVEGGQVQAPPTVNITNSVTSVTGNSGFSGGNVNADGGLPVSERGLVYSTSQNPTIDNSKVTSGNGTGTFTATISGLNQGTTYYVKAYATNDLGTGYGPQVSFTTLHLPVGSNNSATINEDNSYTFSETSFTFSDGDGNTFAGIRIIDIPEKGLLQYNGSDASANQLCSDVTNLRFIPAENENGTPYATFTFKVIDSSGAESASTYTFTINVTAVDDPPVSTGNDTSPTYYAATGTPVQLFPAFTLTDVDGGDVAGLKIYFSSGHHNDQDNLQFTSQNGITGTFVKSTGMLTLTGTTTAENYQAAVRSITYTNNATGIASEDQRVMGISLSQSAYSPVSGHYYEYVSTTLSWTSAKTAAEQKSLYGLQGYLATVTSQAENDFIREKLGSDAWIGGTDSYEENKWIWATGPEAGTQFWQGLYTGTNLTYSNWNSSEPNNSGDEDYLEIFCSSSTPGKWNDLPSSYSLGYVVEYGGMSGDPVLPSLYTSTTLNVVANRPPVANNDGTYNVFTGATVMGNLLTNDTDADGDDLDVTATPSLTHGSFDSFNLETGAFVYRAPLNWSGTFTFDYTISDGTETSTATVTITVTDNIPPVVATKNITVQLDASGSATIAPADINNGSADNCGIASYALDMTSFDCGDVIVPPANFDNCILDANYSVTGTNANSGPNGQSFTALTTGYLSKMEVSSAGQLQIRIRKYVSEELASAFTGEIMATSDTYFAGSSIAFNTVHFSEPPLLIAGEKYFFEEIGSGIAYHKIVGTYEGGAAVNETNSSYVRDIPFKTYICPITPVTVTLTVTDVNHLTASKTAVVIVEDNIAPVALCQDVTVQLDTSGNGSTTAEAVNNSSNDACGIQSLSLSQTDFDCSEVGANTVTLTVTDVNGNSSTCSAEVTVLDTVSPVALCKDITVYLDATGNQGIAEDSINNHSTDACGVLTFDTDVTSFSCSDVSEINPVVLTVTDVNGNISTCSAEVTVLDTVSPVALCKDITVYLDATGNQGIAEDSVNNHSTDACGVLTFDTDVTSFSCSDVSEINPVVLTVTDVNGNSSTCPAEVTVLDTVSPVALCKDITVYLDATGNQGIAEDSVNNHSTDACGVLTFDTDVTSFSCSDVSEINPVVLTVTDVNGNISTCSAEVTVLDTVSPVALCKDITVYLDATGNQGIAEDSVNNHSTDACGVLTFDTDVTSFSCSDVSEINPVVLTVTDVNGNISTCSAEVTVLDTVSPLLSIQNITVYLDREGGAAIKEADLVTAASDNCAVQDTAISVSTFGCNNTGDNEVIVTLRDVNGNQTEETAIVTVLDEILPVAVCKDVTLFLDETGHAPLTGEEVDGGSRDNCGFSGFDVDIPNFDCNDLGENMVVLTVTDNSGNTANCEAQVTVVDIQVPQIDTIPDVEVVVAAGVCETTIDYPHPYVYDNCEITLELLSGLGENGVFPVGTTTETWVATDKWDNSDTLSFNVTVKATNTAPTIHTIHNLWLRKNSVTGTIPLSGISGGNDCEPQTVTVSAESSNAGLVSVTVNYTEGETGSLELAITPEMTGEAEISITVTDSEEASTTTHFTVTVSTQLPGNHPPYVVTPIADQMVNASYVLKVPVPAGMFADADGDELQVKVLMQETDTLPEWAVFASDTIYFTPVIADTGCYHILVKASDPDGAFATDTFQVCVEGYPVSAGEIAAGGFGVNMYPNPTRGEVTIGISSGFHNVELTVSDIAGRAVLRKQYSMVERITFDMSNKVSGMYLVTLDIDGERTVKKLVVDRK